MTAQEKEEEEEEEEQEEEQKEEGAESKVKGKGGHWQSNINSNDYKTGSFKSSYNYLIHLYFALYSNPLAMFELQSLFLSEYAQ